jgi:hypothetical protein
MMRRRGFLAALLAAFVARKLPTAEPTEVRTVPEAWSEIDEALAELSKVFGPMTEKHLSEPFRRRSRYNGGGIVRVPKGNFYVGPE